MSSDKQTIAVYDAHCERYAATFSDAGTNPTLLQFMQRVKPGGAILDYGCGPGIQAAVMLNHGFRVTAIDASAAMVEAAKKHSGLDVEKAQFDDLNQQSAYDAVWANFSLLHVRRAALPNLIFRISSALKSCGIFHIGMKLGSGEKRDKLEAAPWSRMRSCT